MTDPIFRPTLGTELVAHALNRDLDRTVVVLADGTTQSAGQLRDAISLAHQAFEALDPKPRRAAVLARNRVEVPAIMNALSFAGVVATALHPMGAIEDYLYVIEDAEIDLLIYDADHFEAMAYYNLGIGYGYSGAYKEGLEALQQAITLDPDPRYREQLAVVRGFQEDAARLAKHINAVH